MVIFVMWFTVLVHTLLINQSKSGSVELSKDGVQSMRSHLWQLDQKLLTFTLLSRCKSCLECLDQNTQNSRCCCHEHTDFLLDFYKSEPGFVWDTYGIHPDVVVSMSSTELPIPSTTTSLVIYTFISSCLQMSSINLPRGFSRIILYLGWQVSWDLV